MASEHKRKPQEDQEGPTEPKKTCNPTDDNNFFVNFPGNYIRRLANICEHSICHSGVDPINVLKLRPLVFMRCNATDATPFSEAYCKVSQLRDRTNNKRQVFGSIFRKGLDILLGYCKNRTIPDDQQERLVLEKLLRYLVNEEIQSPLLGLAELEDTDLSIVLTNHLFGQLSLTPKHVIDKNSAGKKTKCPCSQSCGMPCNFGDTSIGNEEVWHGNLDVIINHDVVLSNPLIDESDSPGKASGEVKASILPRNNQTIAQSVVFSFLQKQSHPGKHALCPCIGVARNDLITYFYDSEYDVLLESSLIPLRPDSGITPHTKLSTTAIIVSWLVMNHRILCSGLPEDLKSNAAAEFFEQANGKLEVYRGSLRLGNVESLSYAYSDDSDEEVETPAYLSDVRSEFYAISRASLNNRYQYS